MANKALSRFVSVATAEKKERKQEQRKLVFFFSVLVFLFADEVFKRLS